MINLSDKLEVFHLKRCRHLLVLGFITLVAGCFQQRQDSVVIPEFDISEQRPGGSMTAKRLSHRTFIAVGANIDSDAELEFWTGFSLFRDPWVIAPSSTKDRDGLGPLFNTRSCISCHKNGGRGAAPEIGPSKPSALVMRLGVKDIVSDNFVLSASNTYRSYGDQIQPRAISTSHPTLPEPLQGEAELSLSYQEQSGQYKDGTSYSLRAPTYRLVSVAYGDIEAEVGLSPRFAPVIYGVGLLDAIDKQDLLEQEDENDANQDGVSARYNRVPDLQNVQQLALGRFGLKAKHPSLIQQVAAAFRDDIGITNRLFPFESCSELQKECETAAQLGGQDGVEIPDKLLDLVLAVNQYMAVPPARELQAFKVQAGRKLFFETGCHLCHTPSYTTDKEYPVSALANQLIWPYTDLALHDMGPLLADGVKEYQATGQEWRTPPLWGLGLQKDYRQEPLFLHDGRARSIEEAILWHGGEAKNSQQYFINLSKSQRKELLSFLEAI